MNEARPYASLSSGLLARKGSAKPAMRPQGYAALDDCGWNDMGYEPAPEPSLVAPLPEHVPSSIAALTPAPKGGYARAELGVDEEEEVEELPVETAEAAPEQAVDVSESTEFPAPDTEISPPPAPDAPSVVAQQRAILEQFDAVEDVEEFPEAAAPAAAPRRSARAEVVPLPQRAAVAAGRKAAFTLRLDAGRHLRLRLACAVTGHSAQQIVTGALDAALADIPEIEALAARVPAKAAKRN